jgi:BlaI family transcriptional regulator, penicillinase repressor
MAKKASQRPTVGELAILRVLWARGPSTVRMIHETLYPSGKAGYTTTLKLLQIMTGKGFVLRNVADRSHVYRAKFTEDQTQRSLVDDLLARAFGGSAHKLVLHALAAKKASRQELAEIKRLLDDLESKA